MARLTIAVLVGLGMVACGGGSDDIRGLSQQGQGTTVQSGTAGNDEQAADDAEERGKNLSTTVPGQGRVEPSN